MAGCTIHEAHLALYYGGSVGAARESWEAGRPLRRLQQNLQAREGECQGDGLEKGNAEWQVPGAMVRRYYRDRKTCSHHPCRTDDGQAIELLGVTSPPLPLLPWDWKLPLPWPSLAGRGC